MPMQRLRTSRPPVPDRDLNGLVRLRRELIEAGMTDQQITRLVRDKQLHRVRHGVYVDGGTWDGCTAQERHGLLARGVLARAHGDTVLTHVSSLTERRVPLWGVSLDVAHTTREGPERAGRRQPDWIPHRGRISPGDVEVLNGVPVSRAARSAFELMTIAGVEVGLVAVNRLLHAGQMTLTELHDFAEAHTAWPGSLTANVVVRLADHRPESVGEDRFSYLAYAQGLPRPTPQVEVHDERGRVVARVDFAWPDLGVFLEFDGREKYERYRREGETLEEFLMREKRRQEHICMLTGWTCIRITWADLARPTWLATRIREVIASRAQFAG